MCNHPDAVKEIFVTNWRKFGKTDRFKQLIGSVDGQGLVVSEGDLWRKQRRIIQPSFSHELIIKEHAASIVRETTQHISNWKPGTILNLHDEMTAITLKIAARIFFDVDATSEAKDLADSVSTLSRILYQEFSELVPLPDWLPFPSKIEKRKAIATLDKFIYGVIEKHKKDPELHTVVSMLLNARDTEGDGSGMSEVQVRDEAITLFNAGHDTTATALAWSFYLILRDDQICEKVNAEIDAACRNNKPNVGCLPLVPLTVQCIKEAMRMYAPVWMIPRQCNENVEFFGYHLKKGTQLNVSPYVIQRDPRFFENPDQFLPDRFSAENEKSIYPNAFFPFGAGPRSCIGREFSMMEMPLIVATISQQFRLDLEADSKNIGMNPLVSLEPKEPIHFRVKAKH